MSLKPGPPGARPWETPSAPASESSVSRMKTQSSQTSSRLHDLKELLLGDEQKELHSLAARLAKTEASLASLATELEDREQELSRQIAGEKTELKSLREALEKREDYSLARLRDDLAPALREKKKQGPEACDDLADAMQASTISAIQKSVQSDKQPLTEALFPIMGPAIRNYVVDLVRGMIEDLNQSIQNATSFERIKWRLQAKLAGKSYSEYVLLKTRSFSVDEVYLMQRDTGLLLLHEAKNPAAKATDEADLVSGMFTAIRSFVKDSFSSDGSKGEESEGELDRFTFGNQEVLIEVGPSLVLAAVVRGVPSPALRDALKSILEELHASLQPVLERFSGDTAEVERARPVLTQAFIEQTTESEETKGAKLWRAWATLAVLALVLGALVFLSAREQSRWNKFECKLRSEAGISLSEVKKSGILPRRTVRGIRDPLSTDPAQLAREHEINLNRTDFFFGLVPSLEEPFRTQRTQAQEFALQKREQELALRISELESRLAKSEQTQKAQLEQTTRSLIKSFFSDIPNLVIDFEEKTILLRGKLSPPDLAKVRSRVAPLQSYRSIDTSDLVGDSSTLLQNLRTRIEDTELRFQKGTLQLERQDDLGKLSELIGEFDELATEVRTSYQIQIIAHPLIGTNREANRRVETQRSKVISQMLTDKGFAQRLLPPILSEDLTKAGEGITFQVLTK